MSVFNCETGSVNTGRRVRQDQQLHFLPEICLVAKFYDIRLSC